jgi:hypothetical protein
LVYPTLNGNADDNGRMIAAPMVVLAAQYMDMRCVRGTAKPEGVRREQMLLEPESSVRPFA